MSGIIDNNGIQWEHCNVCGASTELSNLGYLPPNKNYAHGLDICIKCVNTLSQSDIRKVIPSTSWQRKEV